MARNYSSIAGVKTLANDITSSSADQLTLSENTDDLPSPPFTLVINPDTAKEEIVTVIADQTGVSEPTYKIARGQEGTTPTTHTQNDTVKHMITGRDLQEPQDHITATAAHGATGAVVGTTNTQTLTNKTLTSPKINENVALTATSTELNVLDGITASTTELNYTDGVTSSIQTQIDALLPKGMISPFAGSSASVPTGWLLCNGSAVSRTTYSALFAVIGTTYGVGDNSTTFNVPDLLGRVPMGAGAGTDLTARTLGAELGVESVTLTAAQSGSPSHDHGVTSVGGGGHTASGSIATGSHGHSLIMRFTTQATHDHAISGASNPIPAMQGDPSGGDIGNYNGTAVAGVGDLGGSASVSVADHSHSIDITPSTATNAAEAHTNIQPSTVVNFIIKH